MSNLSQFFSGGGIKSIQSGYIAGASTGGSTSTADQDSRTWDVTVSSVDVNKVIILVDGSSSGSAGGAGRISGSTDSFAVLGRMTSATNLRLSSTQANGSNIAARWQLVEFA
jgi:hypothetical protein